MKRKYIVIILCVIALASIFFGVFQLSKTKKKVEVSVTNSIESEKAGTKQEVIIESQETEKDVNSQEKETIISEELVVDDQSASSADEQTVTGKQAEKDAVPIVSEKVVEKKTVDPEKQNLPTGEEAKGEVGKIVDKLVSWGFAKSSQRKIDTVIIHSSYDALGKDPYSVSGIVEIYKQYEVSAHYLIDRGGVIHRLVADQNVAWHAGVAKMPDGRTDVNSFSIGIEMINTLDGKYTDEQYDAVNSLLSSLKKKYEIKNILGHNEIAPGRKTDPWNINWGKVNR